MPLFIVILLTTIQASAADGNTLISEGKWKEGIDSLRADVERSPLNVTVILDYAAGLLKIGFRDKAAELCRRAIEIDPKSAKAWAELSFVYRHDEAGRIDEVGKDLVEAERAITRATELEPDEKAYIVQRALIDEWKSGTRYRDQEALSRAIQRLEKISADLPALGQGDLLPDALFHAHRFQDVRAFYSREEGRGARPDIHLAAIAATDGPAAAIRQSEGLGRSEDSKKMVLRNAAQLLLFYGEYAKAADLFEAGAILPDSVSASNIQRLRRTKRREAMVLSESPIIAQVQRLIFALFDPDLEADFRGLMVPEWSLVDYRTMGFQLFGILAGYSRVGDQYNQYLDRRTHAALVVSSVTFEAEGFDETGYRVSFADPAARGEKRTIAWVVQRNGEYKILGIRGNVANVGGEALRLARTNDLDGAKQWLDWQSRELRRVENDPLTPPALLKFWPPAKEPTPDLIFAAAASLVAGGGYSQYGVDVLKRVREHFSDTEIQTSIDQAIAEGIFRSGRPIAESLPYWQELRKRYPASPVAFSALALVNFTLGHPEDVLKLAMEVPVDSPLYPWAIRERARAYFVQKEYQNALNAYAEMPRNTILTLSYWNDLALIPLYAPGQVPPNLRWAANAQRRGATVGRPVYETMASVHAEIGNLKEARQWIMQFLARQYRMRSEVWWVMGRIAEHLNIPDATRDLYSKIPETDVRIGPFNYYELAKVRLDVLKKAGK